LFWLWFKRLASGGRTHANKNPITVRDLLDLLSFLIGIPAAVVLLRIAFIIRMKAIILFSYFFAISKRITENTFNNHQMYIKHDNMIFKIF